VNEYPVQPIPGHQSAQCEPPKLAHGSLLPRLEELWIELDPEQRSEGPVRSIPAERRDHQLDL
jgi:hypothetical protein